MKKTLVIGARTKPDRYSNIAIHRLVKYNHPVVAIGLKEGKVAGVSIDTDKPSYTDIDTVTLYLNPKRQESYIDYIISFQPKRVIFNPGTENPHFYEILKNNDIDFEVACTLVLLGTDQY